MSATRRDGTKGHFATRSRQITIIARGVPVNWSNKASPKQWAAKRRRRPLGRVR